MSITRDDIRDFVRDDLIDEEVRELGVILKCRQDVQGEDMRDEIVMQLYRRYQTPAGYMTRNPSLEQMCDKIAKLLKLRKLDGEGWCTLCSLSIGIFEKILTSLPEDEKRELLEQLWGSLEEEQKKQLAAEFNVGDFSALCHASEFMVAHMLGVHMARELSLIAAASLARTLAASEAALLASRVLSRGVAVALGPIGWGLLALSVNDFMGANLKKVVPALMILNVARLRAYPQEAEGYLAEMHARTLAHVSATFTND